jgi:hypothetical protein
LPVGGWPNLGAGFSNNVAGRITALAVDGGTIYAGAADGGASFALVDVAPV